MTDTEIAALTALGCEIAEKNNIHFVESICYEAECPEDSAVIMKVLFGDTGVLAEMDIELACSIVENEQLSRYEGTAWYTCYGHADSVT
ncbi:TPA: hypothetical protein ACIPE5_002141 [Salmonella enterica subsp. diarizonae serovar 61:r:-]